MCFIFLWTARTAKPQEKAEPAYFYRGDFRSSANRDRLCIPPLRAALLQFAAAIASALVTLYLSQPAKPPIYGRLKKAWLKLSVVCTSSRGFLVQKRPIWMSTLGGTSGELDFFYTNEQRPQRWRCPPNRPHHLSVSLRKVSAWHIVE